MKGKKTGVLRVLFRALRHHDCLGHLVLVKVPEYRSSKMLSCNNCDTVWNRDVNAARNLWSIAYHMAMNGNQTPEVFTRSIYVRLITATLISFFYKILNFRSI